MTQNATLPKGWTCQSLKELVEKDSLFVDGDWVESKDQDPDGDVRLIQLADIGDGHYRNRSDRFLTYGKAVDLGCTFLEKGDLLIARMPDPLGRTCIFPGDPKKSVTVVDVCIIRTTNANHRWLMYIINSPQIRADIESLQSGSTRKRISRTNLGKIELPIPPLPEQERIVARIESLFTQLDAGMAGLKRVQAALKRYKASVLKAACEGRLVPQDPSDESAEEPLHQLGKLPLVGDYLQPLPKGWCWTNLPNIGELGRGKSKHRPRNATFLYGGPYPFVQTGDIRQANGKIVTYSQTYSEAGLKQSKLWKRGTLCITIAANIAETAILGFDACFPDSVVGYVAANSVETRFIQYFISTAKDNLERFAPATAQKNINLDILQKLLIPIPPLAEQRRIVAEVERRLSVVQELEQIVLANLQRAERLRQAILKRAFEGRLVEQGPIEECLEENEPERKARDMASFKQGSFF